MWAIVTIIKALGSTPREVGAKMFVRESGEFTGTIGGGHLEQMVLESAKECIQKKESRLEDFPLGAKTGQCCGGFITVWIEVQAVRPQLYVFGAGHVGQAVGEVFKGTSFEVLLIDERKEWSPAPQDWEDFVEHARWGDNVYSVIMTHSHDRDLEILMSLLRRPMKYLGLIGSESKWERFQVRLRARGFSEEELRKVHCPIGVDIGGKSPKEVAISLAAELLSIHYDTSHSSRRGEIQPDGNPQGAHAHRRKAVASSTTGPLS